MNSRIRAIFIILLTALSLISSCDSGSINVPIKAVTLNKTSSEILIGDYEILEATVSPNNATDKTIKWSSSDESIATVTNGIVVAKKIGTTVITASAGGCSDSCIVKVLNAIPVTSISLNKTIVTLVVGGDDETITATISPTDATNKKIIWTTDDENIATVDEGVIHALAIGETTITATSLDGGFSASCNVIVESSDQHNNPLTLEFTGAGSLSITNPAANNLEYSKNGTERTPVLGSINVVCGDIIRLYSDGAGSDYSNTMNISCTSQASCYVYGNVMSLLDPDNYSSATEISDPYAFSGLFCYNTLIENHPSKELLLPAKQLSDRCYMYMFRGCTSITSAPVISATSLGISCCFEMFRDCTSLASAPILPATTLASNCYASMFKACTSLTTVPSLYATTLASHCYDSMFQGCTSLIEAPELPATSLANYCYKSMFSGCSSLTSPPDLNSLTLADSCYESMFSGCSSLTETPSLPAINVSPHCYESMFMNCVNLTEVPLLPSKTLVSSCYKHMFYGCESLTESPELPATSLATCCYESMFGNCISLSSAPDLPALSVANECYKNMFANCIGLTEAPELPATSLYSDSYSGMFQGCVNLTTIKCLATFFNGDNCTTNWLKNVAASGTFIKASEMTSWQIGDSGIPSGWTIQDN